MGLFGTSKPNVKALVRREDVEGLAEAATFRDLLPEGEGETADLGVPVREEAILALGALAAEAGNGTVSGALSDPSDRVRVAAVRVLYAREQVRPIAEALGWLPADPGHARRLALQAIAELGRADCARTLAGALVRAAGDEPIGDEEFDLLETLLETGEDTGVRGEVIAELLSALANEREAVVDRAEELLAHLAPGSLDSVIAELRSGAAPHRAAAVLGRIKDTRALDPLVEALEHRDPRVRAASAAALGELRDPAAVEPLLRATRDSEHSVRAQAGWALDRIGTLAIMVGITHLMRPMIHEAINSAGEIPLALPETATDNIAAEAERRVREAEEAERRAKDAAEAERRAAETAEAERRARDAAEVAQREAAAAAERALEVIRSAERHLDEVRENASRETGALREAIAEAAARPEPVAEAPAPPAEPAQPVTEPFAAEKPAAEEPVTEPFAPEPVADEPVTEPFEEEHEAEEQPVEEPVVAFEEPVEAPEDPEPEDLDVGEFGLALLRARIPGTVEARLLGSARSAAQIRTRFAWKTDDELAEAFELTVEARAAAERTSSEEEARYWEALVRTTVEEASGRPNFGEQVDAEETVGRREKKRRAKRIKSLAQARNGTAAAASAPDGSADL